MQKAYCLVTGGNKGIGLAIIKVMMAQKFPYNFILCSRDSQNGLKAKEELESNNPDYKGCVHVEVLDIADRKSRKTFESSFKDKYQS